MSAPVRIPFFAVTHHEIHGRQSVCRHKQYQKAYHLNPILDKKDYYENLIQEKQRDLAGVEAELKQLDVSP